MSTGGGVGGAGGAGGSKGAGEAERAGAVGSADKSVSATEAKELAAEAMKTSDATAAAVGASMGKTAAVDTVQAAKPGPAAAAAKPGLLESAATWTGQTLKGYATGAANTVLDAANLVNTGVNAGFGLAGLETRLRTDMKLEATSPAEKAAQDAIGIASMAAGVAGAAKSAPALARAMDEAVDLGRSLLGGGSKAPAGATAAGATAAVGKLGDLTPSEIAKIQAAADHLGADLYVVGSAAKGARRNAGSDLPLAQFGGSKSGTRSDIDYAVKTGLDDAASALRLPDMDSSWGVRGVDYLNLSSSPAIRFSPGKAPEVLSGNGRLYLE